MRKKYELKFDEQTNKMKRVSVVADPAVGTGVVYFSKEESDVLLFTNDEKQIFYSIAMRPNILIPRNNVEGEEAEVFYKPETVEKMQQYYFKNNGNKETNIDHKDEITEGIYPFESWIVQNKDVDKAKEIGLSVNDGDWVMAYKVENPELWQDVKDGKIGGLSIESSFMFEEKMSTNTNTNIEMNTDKKKSFLEKFTALFQTEFAEDEQKTDEVATEEKKDEAEMAEEPTPEAPAVDVEALKSENVDLKQQIADLQEALGKAEAKVIEKEAVVTEMSKQVLEMSKQTANVPEKKYEEMTNKEKLKFNGGI